MNRRTDHDVQIGHRIQTRRKELGLTQSALAKAIGVTYQQVQKYERGLNAIAAGRLQQLAEALGVPAEYFYDIVPEALTTLVAGTRIDQHELIDLTRWYLRIPGSNLRRSVLRLVQTAAEETGSTVDD